MVDTNVVISYALFRSPKIRQALEIAWDVGNVLVIPDYVLAEAREVVTRKWPARLGGLELFFSRIRFEGVPDGPAPEGLRIRDPKDLPVLAAALAGRADVIVTGDKDFASADTCGVPALTPAEFVERHLAGRPLS
ncbi:MAG: PIN domain-containing protein [Eggerthellaceae bacterium]|nr:PIN domain-containing protein [Eggerthellaceae bacterium]